MLDPYEVDMGPGEPLNIPYETLPYVVSTLEALIDLGINGTHKVGGGVGDSINIIDRPVLARKDVGEFVACMEQSVIQFKPSGLKVAGLLRALFCRTSSRGTP